MGVSAQGQMLPRSAGVSRWQQVKTKNKDKNLPRFIPFGRGCFQKSLEVASPLSWVGTQQVKSFSTVSYRQSVYRVRNASDKYQC